MLAPNIFKAKAAEHEARAKVWGDAESICVGLQHTLEIAPHLVTEAVRSYVESAIKAVHEAADRYDPQQAGATHLTVDRTDE